MKKNGLICMLMAWILVLQAAFSCVPAQGVETGTAVANGCSTTDARVPLAGSEQLLPTAHAAMLYELNSDSMIYAWNPDVQINPSSMVKLMTALIVVEQGNLDEMVTVSSEALDSLTPGVLRAGLKNNEKISMRDLLYCMMVASANDAAAVLARQIGGSQSGFVELMNRRAAELGCTDTVFANPHGLEDERQHTTARDLAKIMTVGLKNPDFRAAFSASSYTVEKTNLSEARELTTTNLMMLKSSTYGYYDARVTGGKTAAPSTADRSVICTAQENGMDLLIIVMDAQAQLTENGLAVISYGSFDEATQLLRMGFGKYSVKQLLHSEQAMRQIPVLDGKNDVVGSPEHDVLVTLPIGTTEADLSIRYSANPLVAPLKADSSVGSVEIWCQSVCVAQCNLKAMYGVEKAEPTTAVEPALTQEPEKRAAGGWKQVGVVIAILLAGMLAVLLVLVAIRALRGAAIRRQRRRRRKSRRRTRG